MAAVLRVLALAVATGTSMNKPSGVSSYANWSFAQWW